MSVVECIGKQFSITFIGLDRTIRKNWQPWSSLCWVERKKIDLSGLNLRKELLKRKNRGWVSTISPGRALLFGNQREFMPMSTTIKLLIIDLARNLPILIWLPQMQSLSTKTLLGGPLNPTSHSHKCNLKFNHNHKCSHNHKFSNCDQNRLKIALNLPQRPSKVNSNLATSKNQDLYGTYFLRIPTQPPQK